MADAPWLTIVGLGEDGPEGLPPASQKAIARAEVVMGPPRHLSLLPGLGAEIIEWPVPFADGLSLLEQHRGRQTVVLASGDPFWFGAGSVLAREFAAGEWSALPGPSCFSIAAARMGWPIETTHCMGLHAAPFTRLRPMLATGTRAIVTLRDGASVHHLATYLESQGASDTRLTVFEALGGPRERITDTTVGSIAEQRFDHPVCVALEIAGDIAVLPATSGRPDTVFVSDGVMTKRPIRALTLSALAPKPYEHLWDIGGGSGSVAIEWLLSHPTVTATSFELRPDRAARIVENADRLGVDRLRVVGGRVPDTLANQEKPDVVFVGGGLDAELLDHLTTTLSPGTRLVTNAVTLETEALVTHAHARLGGDLMRIALSEPVPLGPKRGWKSSYPVVQWSVTL